ncbi:MAG: MaoC family dehydratase [Pseudomonadota bacterium]
MSYFNDLVLGRRRDLGSYTFTRDAIKAFAGRYDPQRFHLSEEEAAQTHFGRLCASGWHTAAVWMKLNTKTWDREIEAYIADGNPRPVIGPSPGFENLKWIKPVYVDDTITYYATLTGKRALSSRPEWGMLDAFNEGFNQVGERVFSFNGHVMVRI